MPEQQPALNSNMIGLLASLLQRQFALTYGVVVATMYLHIRGIRDIAGRRHDIQLFFTGGAEFFYLKRASVEGSQTSGNFLTDALEHIIIFALNPHRTWCRGRLRRRPRPGGMKMKIEDGL